MGLPEFGYYFMVALFANTGNFIEPENNIFIPTSVSANNSIFELMA